MKLIELHANCYRSLRSAQIELNNFNLFIGANAAGKRASNSTWRLRERQ